VPGRTLVPATACRACSLVTCRGVLTRLPG